MPTPTVRDLIGLVVWYALAAGVLWLAQRLHEQGRPSWLTRKFVHVMAGLSVYELLIIVEHWEWGIVPFATFIPVNAWLTWGRPPASFGDDNSTPGPFYFAVVITILLLWGWPRGHQGFAVALLAPMIFGDAAAAVVGRLRGRRYYRLLDAAHPKSVEGSAAMLSVSFVACTVTLLLFTQLPPAGALILAGALAIATTLVEAISPHGLDNLTVPFAGVVVWAFAVFAL